MICVRKRYFRLNRLLLLSVGLWPDNQTRFSRLQTTLVCIIVMSFIVLQLLRLFVTECNFDFVIKILSSTIFFIIPVIKVVSFWINIEVMKNLLDQMQRIYDGLKDRNEIAIYDKYGYIAKHFTANGTVVALCSICFTSLMLYWPYVLDVVMPKNESYVIHMMEIVTKYFAVSEKYYLLVILHMNAVCSTGIIAMMATGTILISYFVHVCGMFEIASYRIEQAMPTDSLHKFKMKSEIVIYRKMIYAIDIHRKAMEFAEYLTSNIEGSYLFLILTGVLCLALNLYRIFQVESFAEKIEEVFLRLSIVLAITSYNFAANYTAQKVTDYSNQIYVTTYNVSWYLSSIRVQKLVLFMLQRSNKIFFLTLFGMITASIECFASLMSASISYFTFMYSMQQ